MSTTNLLNLRIDFTIFFLVFFEGLQSLFFGPFCQFWSQLNFLTGRKTKRKNSESKDQIGFSLVLVLNDTETITCHMSTTNLLNLQIDFTIIFLVVFWGTAKFFLALFVNFDLNWIFKLVEKQNQQVQNQRLVVGMYVLVLVKKDGENFENEQTI